MLVESGFRFLRLVLTSVEAHLMQEWWCGQPDQLPVTPTMYRLCPKAERRVLF